MEHLMKTWNGLRVREQNVGLKVTSHSPAQVEVI